MTPEMQTLRITLAAHREAALAVALVHHAGVCAGLCLQYPQAADAIGKSMEHLKPLAEWGNHLSEIDNLFKLAGVDK